MNFFIVTKKGILILILILILSVGTIFVPLTIISSSPKNEYSIVIDAGHGGIDGGSVGVVTGNTENVLNLEYANCLKKYFEKNGCKVVMTRNDLNGLYSQTSQNKKKDDMLKRKEIILKNNPSVVISVHMNSFPLSSSHGAQVFYKEDDNASKLLADSIQNCLIEQIPNSRKNSEIGDYYILNCSSIPSVIVECGFLSNKNEDILLSKQDYKNKICQTIFSGVIKFLMQTFEFDG